MLNLLYLDISVFFLTQRQVFNFKKYLIFSTFSEIHTNKEYLYVVYTKAHSSNGREFFLPWRGGFTLQGVADYLFLSSMHTEASSSSAWCTSQLERKQISSQQMCAF